MRSEPPLPPGEDGLENNLDGARVASLPPELRQDKADAVTEGPDAPDEAAFLKIAQRLVSESDSSDVYSHNRERWIENYYAFHNKHFPRSKYYSPEFRARSKIFRPKTRTNVRRDQAALAASLFSTSDVVKCSPGNDADPIQRAGADLAQELLNYRTDRSNHKASIPWFVSVMGARQDALINGVCCSKQYWLQELRYDGEEPFIDEITGEEGTRPVYVKEIDRPDSMLVPPENVIIDAGADWRNPAETAAALIIKWPMRFEQIKEKQKHPLNPWRDIGDDLLTGSANRTDTSTPSTVRRSREQGIDRYDSQNQPDRKNFGIIWVYECFMRKDGESWHFYSLDHRKLLTDIRPVREAYPEQGGLRPITIGYGAIESHRIFPMSPVESWQQLQREANDLVNLRMDGVKQAITPSTIYKRGSGIDVAQLQRRGQNSVIGADNPQTDIQFERPSEPGQSAYVEMERLNSDMDTLSGVFDQGSVQTNRTLNETVGGMKLLAGAANAVQEFDQRVFVETWIEPVLTQILHCIQHYEDDAKILAICGNRAKMFQKHGVDTITNQLLDQDVTLRVNIGVGAGDPEQRLQKFQTAFQVIAPVWQADPQVRSGAIKINTPALTDEVFGAAGITSAAERFLIIQPPQPDPAAQAQAEKLGSEVEKNRSQARLNDAKAEETTARIGMDRFNMVHGVLKDVVQGRQSGADRQEKARQFDAGREDKAKDRNARFGGGKPQPNAGPPEGDGLPVPPPAPPAGQPADGPMPMPPGTNEPEQGMIRFVRDPQTNKVIGAIKQVNGKPTFFKVERDERGQIIGAVIGNQEMAASA